MNSEQINAVLDNLASKLGIATDKLYPIMIKQAFLDGIMYLIGLLVCISTLIAMWCFFKYVRKEDKNGNYICKHWDNEWIPFVCTYAIIGMVAVAFMILLPHVMINALFNPEWYSIEKILSLLK